MCIRDRQVGGVDFVSGAVAVFGLHHTLYHDLSVGNVLLLSLIHI